MVRVTSTAPDFTQLALTFRLTQVQVNVDLGPGTFVLNVPDTFVSMTLEDLRATRPLREGKTSR